MPERGTAIARFLGKAGWADADRAPLQGDMSARRYVRLTSGRGKRAILMDAPPEADPSAPAFVAMTDTLRNLGLSAPEIYAADTRAGLLLLEDLGDDLFTKIIARNPSRQRQLYEDTLPLLLALRQAAPPNLPQPSASNLIDATRIADASIPSVDVRELDRFRAVLETVLARALSRPATLSLRDFHADNLLWLPCREGIKRIGLLDYQDAFLTHPIYDLVSLLTDARTDVSPELRTDILNKYVKMTGDNIVATTEAFAAFSAQRNLRILGLFARNPSKAELIPRAWRYLSEAADHKALAPARHHLDRGLPGFHL